MYTFILASFSPSFPSSIFPSSRLLSFPPSRTLSLPPSFPPSFLLSSFSYSVRMAHSLRYMKLHQNHRLSYNFHPVVHLSPAVVIVLRNLSSHALVHLQMTGPPFLLLPTLALCLLGLITLARASVPLPSPQGLLSVLLLPQFLGSGGSPLLSLQPLTSNKVLAQDQNLQG